MSQMADKPPAASSSPGPSKGSGKGKAAAPPPPPPPKTPVVPPDQPVTYYVRHLTRYRYGQPVTLSHHAAHLTPRSVERQTCHTAQVSITPLPAIRSERTDYFGNLASFFTVEQTHTELTVVAESRVTVQPLALPPPATTPDWEEVADELAALGDDQTLAIAEFTQPSPLVPRLAALRALAAPSFPPGRPILAGAIDLTRRIHADFTYDPTATDLATPLSKVLEGKRGVCQDFAHVQIGALRALGLAARYVSGYILTDGGLTGADASHAWLSLWIPGLGWVDFDPTNDKVVGNEHVLVAWGRDFEDVSPLKGMMVGGAAHTLEVAVRVAPERRTPPSLLPGGREAPRAPAPHPPTPHPREPAR